MTSEIKERRQAKTRAQRFLNCMETGFGFPPKLAEAIYIEAESCLSGSEMTLQPGQMQVILVQRTAVHGTALKELPKQEVCWTIDAGVEDVQVQEEHGSVALRRTRIQRLVSEAVEQGAVASQEDLAQALQVSVRTIKRDCKALEEAGIYVATRGRLQGIGRGQTHKAQIVKRWLQGATYDQVARATQHSLTSVKRYVQTFVRTVQLQTKGFAPGEISLALQIGQPLVAEYLTVYAQNDSLFSRRRLSEELERLQRPQQWAKKGAR